jgi:cytochrome c oxidase cbb3-type subunit 4
MDLLRSILTPVVGIVLFLMIVKWAYGEKSKQGYEEAANLPFADDDEQPGQGGPVIDQRKMR